MEEIFFVVFYLPKEGFFTLYLVPFFLCWMFLEYYSPFLLDCIIVERLLLLWRNLLTCAGEYSIIHINLPTSSIRAWLWGYVFLKGMEIEENSTSMVKLNIQIGLCGSP